ncbi:hypothetical protein MTO96_027927 [Rhipicephalus appendiculatus]
MRRDNACWLTERSSGGTKFKHAGTSLPLLPLYGAAQRRLAAQTSTAVASPAIVSIMLRRESPKKAGTSGGDAQWNVILEREANWRRHSENALMIHWRPEPCPMIAQPPGSDVTEAAANLLGTCSLPLRTG